jgi:hypothetical protein
MRSIQTIWGSVPSQKLLLFHREPYTASRTPRSSISPSVPRPPLLPFPHEPQRILSTYFRSKLSFILLAVFFAVQRIGVSCHVQHILMSRTISLGTQIDFDSLIVTWFNSVSADERKCTGPELVDVCSKVHIYVHVEIS